MGLEAPREQVPGDGRGVGPHEHLRVVGPRLPAATAVSRHHRNNQDFVCAARSPATGRFVVLLLDGHGDGAEHLTRDVVPGRLLPALRDALVAPSVTVAAFDRTLQAEWVHAGSTLTGLVVHPRDGRVQVLNLGDSRTVLFDTSGGVLFGTVDHTPAHPGEADRIRTAGGFVADNRVNGRLAVSRALGDFEYKAPYPLVSARADVRVLRPRVPFVAALMSDGVWASAAFSDVLGMLRGLVRALSEPPTEAELAEASAALVSTFGRGADDCTAALVYVEPTA